MFKIFAFPHTVYWEAHIWLCTRSHLNFLIYEENVVFFFISAITARGWCFISGFLSMAYFSCKKIESTGQYVFGHTVRKAYRTKTIENVIFSALPKRWELWGWKKLVSMTKSQYFVTPGSDLPPCLTGGGGRDLQKPAFNTYYGARGIKYQYIYIAFIFLRSSCQPFLTFLKLASFLKKIV